MKKVLLLLLLPVTFGFSQSITLEPADGIELNDENQHIQYSDNSLSNKSMFFMFKQSTSNLDKMVISHSPGFPTWGLQYTDSNDEFVFRNGASEIMKVGLNGTGITMNAATQINESINITGAASIGGNATVTGTSFLNGGTTTSSLRLSNGGSNQDFLVKNASNDVINKKGNNRLGVNFIIATVGTFPSPTSTTNDNKNISSSDPFLGEITMFAGNFAPNGWALCDGQLLPISSYSALFSILGTTYGGDGITNFALPDLRAAAPVHEGTATNGLQWSLGEKD